MNQAASGTKKRSKILSMALIALFAALTAVLSQIAIPTPWQIPISLGNLAGFLAVGLLTWEEAALSQVVWVLLGVVGAPVFSGMGSLSRLVGPTGGYIIGYIVSAVAAGLILTKIGYRFWKMVAALVVGLLLCYLFGTVWYVIVMKQTSFWAALLACVFPYIPFDLVKIVLVSLLSLKLQPILKAA